MCFDCMIGILGVAFVSPPGSIEVGVRTVEAGRATVGVYVVWVEVSSGGASLSSHAGWCPCGHL